MIYVLASSKSLKANFCPETRKLLLAQVKTLFLPYGFSRSNSRCFISNFSLVYEFNHVKIHLCDESRSGARLVLPVRWKDGLDLVVAGQTVNTRFNQNQAEFAVDVLTIAFQMLADAHGSLDQEVKVLGNVGLEADGLHDSQNFVAVDESHLSDTVRVTKNDT